MWGGGGGGEGGTLVVWVVYTDVDTDPKVYTVTLKTAKLPII